MVNLSRIGTNVENGARKFISGMNKDGEYAPIILLEAAVVAGRTYQAYQRGGFIEARERVTEESLGSIFWLGGVAMFGKMIDFIGKKALKIKDMNFDVGKDHARNSFKNFVAKIVKESEKPLNIENLEKKLSGFKFGKIIASILLANTFMGFIVPKFNQKITKKIQKGKNAPSQHKVKAERTSIEEFLKKKDKNVSFKGFGSLDAAKLLSLSNTFETDARVKLLSTDVGTVSGRGINARNKNERIEVLFRDIVSMYFYYLCQTHINSLLNLIQDGKKDRLDPVSAKQLDSHLRTDFNKNGYNKEDFTKHVLGETVEIPENIASKFNKDNKVISLEEFENLVGKDSELANVARRMSKLQPELHTGAILTESQVQDVFNHKALINQPEFLNDVYNTFTKGASTNPNKFVAEKDLIALKERMADYVQDIIKRAKGENITLETLSKANKANFAKNAVNLGAGFAIAALFLSTLIPKMQYWITRKLTGQDSFPGVQSQK